MLPRWALKKVSERSRENEEYSLQPACISGKERYPTALKESVELDKVLSLSGSLVEHELGIY